MALIINKYLQSSRILDTLAVNQATLIPIPLHVKKKRYRGFNQTEEIGSKLAELQPELIFTPVLERVKLTKTQLSYDRAHRQKNVVDAFGLPAGQKLKGTVVLLDDVVTTGSTLRAAAKVLKDAGAQRVIGLVFAQRQKK